MNKRNFAIIAHIDHGKSTLADRFLETCFALTKREMQSQMLDTLDVERERGITVKSQTVKLNHIYKGENYSLNLIDTPGHVDFSFEVRRALFACENAIVLVDATQGIEAQTIANVYRAIEEDIRLIPVLNKVDLASAQVESVTEQMRDVLGIEDEPSLISAKTGLGVPELLDRIVEMGQAPDDTRGEDFRALLIDSWFDIYLGVILLVRVRGGKLKVGEQVQFFSNKATYKVEQLGFLTPKLLNVKEIEAGDVAVIIANMRNVSECIIGDTVTLSTFKGEKLRTFPPQQAAVYCGIFPPDSSMYQDLKDAISKLALNDASLAIEPTHSPALGVGFRCGFLGLLHLEVVQQRLEDEFDISVIVTAPSVEYRIEQTNGETVRIHDAVTMPAIQKIKTVYEPWVKVTIFSPEEFLGSIMTLCLEKRGRNQDVQYINKIGSIQNISCTYELPLSEVIFDFHDKLKSLSKGYASFDYEECGESETNVAVVEILINGTPVDGLSSIVFRDNAEKRGRWICLQLKEAIPRQLFVVAIQAVIGGKIISRETVSALRKDVTAKCYGGDVSRKRKLLDKQKAGKKRMKEFSVGNVSIPNSAMLKVLRGKDV